MSNIIITTPTVIDKQIILDANGGIWESPLTPEQAAGIAKLDKERAERCQRVQEKHEREEKAKREKNKRK